MWIWPTTPRDYRKKLVSKLSFPTVDYEDELIDEFFSFIKNGPKEECSLEYNEIIKQRLLSKLFKKINFDQYSDVELVTLFELLLMNNSNKALEIINNEIQVIEKLEEQNVGGTILHLGNGLLIFNTPDHSIKEWRKLKKKWRNFNTFSSGYLNESKVFKSFIDKNEIPFILKGHYSWCHNYLHNDMDLRHYIILKMKEKYEKVVILSGCKDCGDFMKYETEDITDEKPFSGIYTTCGNFDLIKDFKFNFFCATNELFPLS